jgi:formylmethanofuran dehydrogenase subunit C
MTGGKLLVHGRAGTAPARWSKHGSIVVSGSIEIPLTYRYACTYQPDHLRLTLLRLRRRYGLAVDDRHVSGFYRRYSGDLAHWGRGEILAWTAE